MINIRVICYTCGNVDSILQCIYIYISIVFPIKLVREIDLSCWQRDLWTRDTTRSEWVESNQDHSLKMKGFKGGSRKVKCRGPPIDFRHRLVPSTTVTVICIEYFTLYLLLCFLSRSSLCTCIVLVVNVLMYLATHT